jgi:hypothetical protein
MRGGLETMNKQHDGSEASVPFIAQSPGSE